MDNLIQIWHVFYSTLLTYQNIQYLLMLIPFVLFFELPLYFVNWMGVFRHLIQDAVRAPVAIRYYPRVTCTITCYSEGKAVQNTVLSLLEQLYPGHVEIIAVVDGVKKNLDTYRALQAIQPVIANYSNRSLIIVPKIQRGGRVSSLNAGLSQAQGEVFMALDGDTSFDNQMIASSVAHFNDQNVVAVTGPMRVRNRKSSLVTRLQAIEYMLTMQVGKLGFAELNVINNVPGAFGIFRKSFIQRIGGWNTGTAEDLDMTIRIKQYHKRYPKLRFEFEPLAVSHTDVPDTFLGFFKQRLRWDGDLWYIYANKHHQGISASKMGWANFIFMIWYGILFQIVMPFAIIIYTFYIAMALQIHILFLSLALVYLFYFCIILIQFVVYLLILSDRKLEDCSALWILPIYPAFQFVARVWSAFAILNQILNKGHLDSAMAPLWVLKKGKQ